jgi:hypothetical protein
LVKRRQVRLRLALPWLELSPGPDTAAGEVTHRAPVAEWMAARGRMLRTPVSDWRAWLLDGPGMHGELLQRFPAGPCTRAAILGGRPAGTWACARPVHLLTAIDHLRLSPARVSLEAGERAALLGDLNRHLQGRGFEFHDSCDGDWCLECETPVECTSVEPAAAAGRNVRDLMPGGRDGARLRSLMNEIQMLLHDHPVNIARTGRGLSAVNSLWLWGFGRLEGEPVTSLPALFTDDAWLAGLWRLHGSTSRRIADFESSVTGAVTESLLGWAEPGDRGAPEAFAWADAHCLAPARDALGRGDAHEVAVLLGDRVLATDRGARFRFWRRVRPLAEVRT